MAGFSRYSRRTDTNLLRNKTRTCDLFCVSVIAGESIMSTPFIRCYKVHPITIYRGQDVYRVHNFHACQYGLHPVAPDEV